MKKILIVGEIYSNNLGDGIICEVVNNYFKKKYSTRYFDLSGRNGYECKKEEDNKFNYFNEELKVIKNKIKDIIYKMGYYKDGKNLNKIITRTNEKFDRLTKEYMPDFILFAGGQMFLDSFVKQIEYICTYAEKNNIPVIFNACGLGKVNSINKNKIEKILNMNCIKYISCRDGIDKLEKMCNKKIIDTYDTAILANAYYDLKNNTSKALGVGIMITYMQPIFKQIIFWKKTLKYLIHNNIEFKIFTNGSISDQNFARYLIKIMHLDEEKYLLSKANKPVELMNNINSFEKILSMRLHSVIVAYSLSIPAIAISWDNKVDAFYRKINRSNLCFKLFENVEILFEKIDDGMNENYDQSKRKEIELVIENNLNAINNILKN